MGADDKSCGLEFACNIYGGDLPVESPPDQALWGRVELYHEHGLGVMILAAPLGMTFTFLDTTGDYRTKSH